MGHSHSIQKYLNCLEEFDYDTLISLFTKDAIVHSPLYGELSANKFYKDLFDNTSQSSITLLNTFRGEKAHVSAAHFQYD